MREWKKMVGQIEMDLDEFQTFKCLRTTARNIRKRPNCENVEWMTDESIHNDNFHFLQYSFIIIINNQIGLKWKRLTKHFFSSKQTNIQRNWCWCCCCFWIMDTVLWILEWIIVGWTNDNRYIGMLIVFMCVCVFGVLVLVLVVLFHTHTHNWTISWSKIKIFIFFTFKNVAEDCFWFYQIQSDTRTHTKHAKHQPATNKQTNKPTLV